MRKTIILFCLLFVSIQSQSQTDVFNALLKTYVNSQGDVDYKGLRKNRALLDLYLKAFEKNCTRKKLVDSKSKSFLD